MVELPVAASPPDSEVPEVSLPGSAGPVRGRLPLVTAGSNGVGDSETTGSLEGVWVGVGVGLIDGLAVGDGVGSAVKVSVVVDGEIDIGGAGNVSALVRVESVLVRGSSS